MTLQEFFDVKESYRLPDKIMEMLLSPDAEKTITQIKEQISCDIRDMFQEEQGDRKSLKQDFTPDCICSIVADLMIDGTCLDMCSGTGALSKMAALKRGIEINEQEFSERTIPFAILDACMNGMQGTISKADCLRNTVQETYLLEERGGISIVSLQERQEAGCFDNVIMNPPYSMKFPEADEMRIMGHKIPKSKADYGFILRGLEHLNRGGRLIAILPHGVLFRGAGEGDIRKWLVQERLINAVIGLPDKLFLNTSIPVFVLILQYDSPDILFIDASKDFIKKSAQNDMTEQQTGKVVDTFLNRQVCIVERAVSGKKYKAGTCFIKLSAVDEFVGQIKEAGNIDSRFAVFEPKKEVDCDYLYIAIKRVFPDFLRRYRTTINLQFSTLVNFILDWHDNEKDQRYIVEQIRMIDNEIEMIERQIDNEKQLKKWYLEKMMANDYP